jgi:hypothetical protein
MNRVIDKIREEQDAVVPLLKDGGPGGGGGRPLAFVPISGEVVAVTAEMLDGGIADDPILQQVAALCRQANLPIDHPMAAQFISALRSGGLLQRKDVTVAEKETQCRGEIAKTCNRADYAKEVPPGTHQKKLHKALGFRSITTMTLKELAHARSVCARICS